MLARRLDAQLVAVDFLQDFLDVLEERAKDAGLSDKITTLACSMDELPFGEGEYDVLWSEGAIYNIGFEKGVTDWNRYLKAGGLLVVSEITWMTASRPAELQTYWEGEYPEIDVASAKIYAYWRRMATLPIGYFVLPEHCWLDNYYQPMQDSFTGFLDRNANSEEAESIVEAQNEKLNCMRNTKLTTAMASTSQESWGRDNHNKLMNLDRKFYAAPLPTACAERQCVFCRTMSTPTS